MAEYIEREAALDCFACDLGKKDYSVSYQGFMTEAAFRINELPAADVRSVARGIWEKQNANLVWNDVGLYAAAYKCNKCGELNIAETNFCPNCGADMREEN